MKYPRKSRLEHSALLWGGKESTVGQTGREMWRSVASDTGIITRARAIICELTPDGTTTFVSPAVTAITGYRQDELVGRNWWELFFEGARREAAHTLCQRFRLGDVTDCEMAITAKDGSTKTLLWTTANRYSAEGTLEGILGFATDITESKQTLQKLQQSEALLKDVFERSPIGIILFDGGGHLLDMNKAALNIFGVANVRELRGVRLLDGAALTDDAKEALHKGETLRCEGSFDFDEIRRRKRFETSRSGVVYLDYFITPLGLKEGEAPVGYLGQVQDITERKRAEEERVHLAQEQAARREAEAARQQVSDTLESISDGFVATDADWRFTYVNAAAERIMGVKRDALLGKLSREVFPLLSRNAYQIAHRVVNERRTIVFEEFNPQLNAWFEVRTFPAKEGVSSYFRDITESKLALQERDRLIAELDATFTALPDGLIVCSPSREVIRANAAAARILGCDSKDGVRPLFDQVKRLRPETSDGKPFPAQAAPVARALRGETVVGEIVVIYLPGNATRWISLSAAPLTGTNGIIWGAVEVLTDLTPLHHLQEQRDDLVRAVSHDLRNPLTIIQGRAELVARSADNPELVRKSAEAIFTSAKRMNVMIQDLVDVARLEARKLALQMRLVDLRSLFSNLLERLGTAEHGSRVKVQIGEDVPRVVADPDRLERVLVNLLTNALKYSAPVTEVTARVEKTGREITVSVADRGIGIPASELGHLFERYHRVSATRKIEGLGLGLYISRMLVEAHGGRIWAESAVGQGSTFYFSLPIVEPS